VIINGIISGSPHNHSLPLEELGEGYQLSRSETAVYRRFYGIDQVVNCELDLESMLENALTEALKSVPDQLRRGGYVIYCKTQTHNTFSDESWLDNLVRSHGLQWEILSWAMTNCASAIAAMNFIKKSKSIEPTIILTGEKAFHPGISRLSVGLLSEIPTAAVLNVARGGWRIIDTNVRHIGRFYENPNDMGVELKADLQEIYTQCMLTFIEESLRKFKKNKHDAFSFIPHNLNLPVTNFVVHQLGWEDRVFYGDVRRQGHAYCSDAFINLNLFESNGTGGARRPGETVFMLAAGTGITFAGCLLEWAPEP
jgi:3-oxoacyl-[acyl-carrier-protein] synthase-3